MAINPPSERRAATRLPDPACPGCAATSVKVTLRTVYVFYCRCDACGHIWHVPKPGFVAPRWWADDLEPRRGVVR